MKNILRYPIYQVLIVLFIIPLLLPLLHNGFPITDDGNWMIIRLSGFYQSLRDGQFPVRFIGRLNHEYGYPVSNFLYPGYLYLGSIFHILGLSFIDSIKVLLATCMVSNGIFCFLWLRRFFSSFSSFLGALVYAFHPYLLFDIYTRGSVGEVLALSIVPVFFYAVEKKSLFFSSLLFGGVILSHNILALLFVPIFSFYIVARNRTLIPSIFYGLLVSCFFWIPALYDLRYVRFSSTTISEWSVYFLDDLTLVGIQTVLILLLSAYFLKKKKNTLGILFMFISIGSIFLSSPLSSPIWSTSSIGKYIQFPWRFLSLAIPSSAYLGAYAFSNLERYRKILYLTLSAVIVFFLFLGTHNRMRSISYDDKTDDYYATNDDTTTVSNEYMPVYVQTDPQNRPSTRVQLIGEGEIVKEHYSTRKYTVDVFAREPLHIQFNTIYFPGWEAVVDTSTTAIQKNNEGLMEIRIPKPGLHAINLEYKQNGIHALSNAVSLVSLGVLSVWYSYALMKQRKIIT